MTKKPLKRAALQVRPSAIHGYGVFAATAIAEGDIIEECLALVTDNKITEFANYLFDAKGSHAIALGCGSIYNHAAIPNANYQYDSIYNTITFRARRTIAKGEEITICYGNNWFSSRDMPVVPLSLWRRCLRWNRYFPSLQRICMVILIIALIYFFLLMLHNK